MVWTVMGASPLPRLAAVDLLIGAIVHARLLFGLARFREDATVM